MQTGTDERGRQAVLDALMAEGALKNTAGSAVGESGSGEEFVRHRSAFFGLGTALPLALIFWALLAALIWAWRR